MRLELSKQKLALVLGIVASVACSPLEITERDDGDTDDAVPPAQITGQYLANFDNSRVRCGYRKDEAVSNGYNVACRLVVTENGNEINATQIDAETRISWLKPKLIAGAVRNLSCRVANNSLTQNCELESETSSANLTFGMEVSSKNKKRNETVDVLLPYSVEVAAGFVPNLPTFEISREEPKEPGKDPIEKNGFQTAQFNQNNVPYHFAALSTCVDTRGLFYIQNGAIYHFKDEMITHVAGSLYQQSQNEFTHPLRYKIKSPNPNIACADGELFLQDDSKIIGMDLKTGKIRIIKDRIVNSDYASLADNFHATESGLLYFQNGTDLIQMNTKTLVEKVVIRDFNTEYIADPKPNRMVSYGSKVSVLENGQLTYFYGAKNEKIEVYFSVVTDFGTARKSFLSSKTNPRGEVFGEDGFIYELIKGDRNISIKDSEGIERKKINTSTWVKPPSGYQEALYTLILRVDKNGKIYLYDHSLGKIVVLNPDHAYALENHTADAKVNVNYTEIVPTNPLFDPNGKLIFMDLNSRNYFGLNKDKPGNLESLGSSQDCFKQSSMAIAKDATKARSCDGVITINHPRLSEPITFGNSTGLGTDVSTEGFIEDEIRTKNPVGFAFDKKGVLYYSDLYRIHKFENGKTSVIAGSPERVYDYNEFGRFADGPASEAGLSSPYGLGIAGNGNIYFADRNSSRIRRIFKKNDGNLYVDTIAGGKSKIGEYNVSSGDGGPALDAVLSCPTEISVTSEGTIYFLDGGCEPDSNEFRLYNPLNSKYPDYYLNYSRQVRKIEFSKKGGLGEATITKFFGNEYGRECGVGKIHGKAGAQSLSKEIDLSLSILCQGIVTGLATKDNCLEENGTVEIAITQGFYTGYGNVILVRQPCKFK